MRNRGVLTAFLSLLAVWVQLMAPLATAALESNNPPDTVICTGEAQQSSPNDSGKVPLSSQHHHCLFCQTCFGGMDLPREQSSAAFSARAVSLLRLRITAASWIESRETRDRQARGPPSLI
jgi:hypothetical protein